MCCWSTAVGTCFSISKFRHERKLFERFLRQVNKLQMQQHLEAQARTGDNGGR
jgi:hypothetical protein